jgi:polysaccharide pyruvyl transferase WcaK-like protein
VAFLRHMDAVIAMRLHACIFTASQGVPLFGIDYYPGHGGKVEQLFADLGHRENAMRIDNFDPQWLVSSLGKQLKALQRTDELA